MTGIQLETVMVITTIEDYTERCPSKASDATSNTAEVRVAGHLVRRMLDSDDVEYIFKEHMLESAPSLVSLRPPPKEDQEDIYYIISLARASSLPFSLSPPPPPPRINV